MARKLSEMSMEELWELFPIVLTEHRDCWKTWYEEERESLCSIFDMECVTRISHIGSTAVPTIWAKPIIDILVEAELKADMQEIKKRLCNRGYICMSESGDRISFNKGYTENGFAKKVFHLHLRLSGDNDELYFRDYLIAYPDIAKEYERLKLNIWKKYEHNRDGYTDAKADFVKEYTSMARKIYTGKYY
ncbi:MAG: GrpB family protein [Lachnospiraceae bacterium]|nr:GrpB family protein [Lachnospiraceae bacterium]